MWPDPRSTRRYIGAARRYIDAHRNEHVACALCGGIIDMGAPSSDPLGPSVEHTIPVRWIRTHAATREECVDMACNQDAWALAHRRCQHQQGARAVNANRSQPANHSRAWW